MTDELDPTTVLALFVRTFALSGLTVIGLVSALSNAPCDKRLIGALIGMASGSVLFIQVACAQIARHYDGGYLASTQGE